MPEKTSITSSKSSYRILSRFGRINYNFDYRYMLSIVARYDGISKLSDNRWGFFPGVSGGWNLQAEDFYKKLKISEVLTTVKPRISYGVNGNVNGIGNYDVYGIYGLQTPYYENSGFLNTGVINSSLKWEKSNTLEFGLDLGILNNKIYVILDYYNRKTSNLLTDLDLPGYTGFNSVKTNLGTIQNTGFEAEIKAYILSNPNGINWDFSANISFVKNKVLKLPYNGLDRNRQGGLEVYNPKTGETMWVGVVQEGKTLGDIYAFKQIRLFKDWEDVWANAADRYDAIGELYGPAAWAALTNTEGKKQIEPGDVFWADLNGDGTIGSKDQVKVGNIYPKWTGGFSSTASYKGLSLYARFDFTLGHTIYNDLLARSLGQYQGSFNVVDKVKQSWSETNTGATYPKFYYADQLAKKNITRINNAGSAINGNNSIFYEKGDYLALRELTLSYKLPTHWIKKAYLSGLMLNVTGQNLFYITKYSGTNPEPAIATGGVDNGRYPIPRNLSLGLTATF